MALLGLVGQAAKLSCVRPMAPDYGYPPCQEI